MTLVPSQIPCPSLDINTPLINGSPDIKLALPYESVRRAWEMKRKYLSINRHQQDTLKEVQEPVGHDSEGLYPPTPRIKTEEFPSPLFASLFGIRESAETQHDGAISDMAKANPEDAQETIKDESHTRNVKLFPNDSDFCRSELHELQCPASNTVNAPTLQTYIRNGIIYQSTLTPCIILTSAVNWLLVSHLKFLVSYPSFGTIPRQLQDYTGSSFVGRESFVNNHACRFDGRYRLGILVPIPWSINHQTDQPFERPPLKNIRRHSPTEHAVNEPLRLFKSAHGVAVYSLPHGSGYNLASQAAGAGGPPFHANAFDDHVHFGHNTGFSGQNHAPPMSSEHSLGQAMGGKDKFQNNLRFLQDAITRGDLDISCLTSAAAALERRYVNSYPSSPLLIPIPLLQGSGIQEPPEPPKKNNSFGSPAGNPIYFLDSMGLGPSSERNQFDHRVTTPVLTTTTEYPLGTEADLLEGSLNHDRPPCPSSREPLHPTVPQVSTDDPETIMTEASSPSANVCPECRKEFTRPCLLKDHMHIHTQEKRL